MNTQVRENFNITVLKDGLSFKLQVKIARAFINLGARACAEFNISYANSRVIMRGFCSTVNAIVKTVLPDFDNIWSLGQIDPLSFTCHVNPGMQVMWHEGDDALRIKLHHDDRIDVNAKHQMMPVLRVTLMSNEVQRKSTVHVQDAVLCCCSSYESGDCTPPPPPSVPFSPPGPQRNGFGGGFPVATGEYIYNSSSSSSMNEPAATQSIRVNNKNSGGNNSPRKHKSAQNNNDGQQVGDNDNDGDAKRGRNIGISIIKDFFVAAREELKKASDGKTDY